MSLNRTNHLPGYVKDLRVGSLVDRIVVQVGEYEVESFMTHEDAEKLHLRVGDTITVFIKPTDVTLERPRKESGRCTTSTAVYSVAIGSVQSDWKGKETLLPESSGTALGR